MTEKYRLLTIYIKSKERISASEWGKLINSTDSILTGVLSEYVEGGVTIKYKSEEV